MRKSTLPRSPMRRQYRDTGPDEATILLVLDRAVRDGRLCCEVCMDPVFGKRGWDYSIHHRLPRGMGGSRSEHINAVTSLMLVDGTGTTGCHGRIESDRAEAYANGWLVSRYSDPAMTAVLIDNGSRFAYLGADGRYHDDPPGGAV